MEFERSFKENFRASSGSGADDSLDLADRLKCGLSSKCQECASLTPILKHILQHLNQSQHHQGYTDLTVSHEGYNQRLSWHFECESCTYKSFYQEEVISHTKRHHSQKTSHRRPAFPPDGGRTVSQLRGFSQASLSSLPHTASPISLHPGRKRLLDRPLSDVSKRKSSAPATVIADSDAVESPGNEDSNLSLELSQPSHIVRRMSESSDKETGEPVENQVFFTTKKSPQDFGDEVNYFDPMSQRVAHSPAGSSDRLKGSRPGVSDNHPYFNSIDAPDHAVKFITHVCEMVQSGVARSVNHALKLLGKDRKSVDRFRNIYYLNCIDKTLASELEKRWRNQGRRGGLYGLDQSCKEALTYDQLKVAEQQGEILIFGKDGSDVVLGRNTEQFGMFQKYSEPSCSKTMACDFGTIGK